MEGDDTLINDEFDFAELDEFFDDVGGFHDVEGTGDDPPEEMKTVSYGHRVEPTYNNNYCNTCDKPMRETESGLLCEICGFTTIQQTPDNTVATHDTVHVQNLYVKATTEDTITNVNSGNTRPTLAVHRAKAVQAVNQFTPLFPSTIDDKQRDRLLNIIVDIICAVQRSPRLNFRGSTARGLYCATVYHVLTHAGYSVNYLDIGRLVGETPHTVSAGANLLIFACNNNYLDAEHREFFNSVVTFNPDYTLSKFFECLKISKEHIVYTATTKLISIILTSQLNQVKRFRCKNGSLCAAALYAMLYLYAERNESNHWVYPFRDLTTSGFSRKCGISTNPKSQPMFEHLCSINGIDLVRLALHVSGVPDKNLPIMKKQPAVTHKVVTPEYARKLTFGVSKKVN